MTPYSMISLILAGSTSIQALANRSYAPLWSATLVTEATQVLSPGDYPGTADDLADKLVRIVDIPQGHLYARDVEKVLNLHLTEVKPSSPAQSLHPFYEAEAGKDWYFNVMLSEAHPHYPTLFHLAYPHLIRSSDFCIPIERVTVGLVKAGYSPSQTKALEPENLELVFYKKSTQVQVGYDRASCMTSISMTGSPDAGRII